MRYFQSKPIQVTAVQLTLEWFEEHATGEQVVPREARHTGYGYMQVCQRTHSVHLPRKTSSMRAGLNDWLVTYSDGETYPVKDETFKLVYSEVCAQVLQVTSNIARVGAFYRRLRSW